MPIAKVKWTAPDKTPSRWWVVLHGFLGSARNWDNMNRALVAARPELGILGVDLRLHGRSQGIAGPHSVRAAARDIHEMVEEEGLELEGVMGHSFGGKVAVMFGEFRPELRQIWMLDSTPSVMSGPTTASQMLDRLEHLVMPMASREQVVNTLVAGGLGLFEARWVASNLSSGPDGVRWRLDFGGLRQMLGDFCQLDLWDQVEVPPPWRELHVVAATRSKVLSQGDLARLSGLEGGGQVWLHPLEAGHWLHVDNPEGLLALLLSHL